MTVLKRKIIKYYNLAQLYWSQWKYANLLKLCTWPLLSELSCEDVCELFASNMRLMG